MHQFVHQNLFNIIIYITEQGVMNFNQNNQTGVNEL